MELEFHPTDSHGGPQMVVEVFDPLLGPLGWVVIDRVVDGSATGGIRMVSDVTVHELALSARTMTLKYAIINVRMGGAKAGLVRTPDELGITRAELMTAFGRALAPLFVRNLYHPACDLGIGLDDFGRICAGAQRTPALGPIDTGKATAVTVFETIREVASFRGIPLNRLRVALEGFGRVGGELARMLADAGASLIGVSTAEGTLIGAPSLDVKRLLELRATHGSSLVHHYPGLSPVPHAELWGLDVDLLIPGARSETIHEGNWSTIRAKCIVPAANAPLTVEAERQLVQRGVLVVPDFLANCGGVLSVDLTSQGFDASDLNALARKVFGPFVGQLLRTAERLNTSVGTVARDLAWLNHTEMSRASRPDSVVTRVGAMLSEQGVSGVWPRLAWRAHSAGWSRRPGVRDRALIHSTGWRVGLSARRLSTLSSAG